MEEDPEGQDCQDCQATVETPLLRARSRCEDEDSATRSAHPHWIRVVAIIIVSIFLLEVGDYMSRAPSVQILEDIICRRFYAPPSSVGSPIARRIPEDQCKVPYVLGKVAMINGWNQSLSYIPAIFLAIPYGYVGDRYGRRIPLILAVLGLLLAQIWMLLVLYFDDIFDVRWIWAGNIFLLIGGGSAVALNSIFAIVADVAPESKRALVFFQVSAAAVISSVVGIPFSRFLMKTDPFDALLAACAFIFLGNCLLLLIPETLQASKESDAALVHAVREPDNEEAVSTAPAKSFHVGLKSLFVQFRDDSRFILANPALCGLIIAFFIGDLSTISVSILVQFASERFQWSLADASFLLPFSSVTNFIILICILPLIYSLFGSHFHLSTSTTDLLVARGSLMLYIIGALIIAFSAGPPSLILGTLIFAGGEGYISATRSLLTSFVHPDHVSRLYGVLAIVTTIGSTFTFPLLSKAFSWGLDLGGAWSGMVSLTVAILYLVFGLPLWMISPPHQPEILPD